MRRRPLAIFAIVFVTCAIITSAFAFSSSANEAGRYYYATYSGMMAGCRC